MVASALHHRRWFTGVALLALLLRVLVPTGYMPAALDSGWYLSLCPHGMPDPAAVAALGHAGHGAHHDHTQQGHDHDAAQGPDHCELGSGFALSAIVAAFASPVALAPALSTIYTYSLPFLARAQTRYYDGRAPPLALSR